MADRQMLTCWIRHRGYVREKWSAWAAPKEGAELRRLLVDAAIRCGGRLQEIAEYDLEVETEQGRRFRFATSYDEVLEVRR